jgi:hypothetical protein
MSTDQQAAAEAAPEEQTAGQEVADQFAEADAAANPVEETPSVEELASEQGWMPQDKFKGPAEKWKPAHEFLRAGKDIQERTARELKEVRSSIDVLTRTSGAIMMDRLAAQHAEFTKRYQAAVERGDPDGAAIALDSIRNIQAQAASAASPARTPQAPARETEAWVAKHQRLWNDPVAQQDALAVCNAYAKSHPNSTPAEQLHYTETHMRARYPFLFDDKPAPQVNGNITRNAGGVSSRTKTAGDLPKEARDMAKDLVERGLIPNEDTFAKHYFEQAQRKA